MLLLETLFSDFNGLHRSYAVTVVVVTDVDVVVTGDEVVV